MKRFILNLNKRLISKYNDKFKKMSTFEVIDIDSESLEPDKKPDDLASAFVGFFTGMNIKLIVMLFLIFILVNSDIFIQKIIAKVNGAVEYKNPTYIGVFLQAFILIILYMFSDLLINLGVI